MAVIATLTKDPDSVLDYQLDWNATTPGPFLESGETISTSTWTVPTGITEDSESETTTTTTIWLSGGTAGSDYELTNQVVTSSGRTVDRSIKILVRER